ncbi:MAG: efflux RND transporter permease subunit [Burkholderiales bacterium]
MKSFNLSEWALAHQQLVLYFIVALLVAGVIAYGNLGQAEDPDFTIKVIVINTQWPGASAEEVELQITERLEKKLQETPWLDHVRSFSRPGQSMIFVLLKDYTPPKEVPEVWYQVRKKISDVRHTLPRGAQGPFVNDEFSDTFGTIFAFTADGFSYSQMKEYADRARAELLHIPNIAKVELLGEQPEKVYIEISHKKLATLGIDPLVIFNILDAQNAMTPSGSVDTASDRIHIRVSGDFNSVESIREIGIRANNRLFRLGDIAHVYRGYADPPVLKMRYKGQDAIGLAVSMGKGGNIIDLGEQLAPAIARIRANLPVGLELHSVADQPTVVKRSVREFMRTLMEAVGIVLLVSFISLGFRTGVVVALSIPLVLAVTFLFMKLFGIDLQRISLGALIIALGLLVDDAIIAVEMMVNKMEQGWDRVRAASFAYTSTAFPMLTGTLVTAVGFLPVGFAKSSAGEYTFSIFAVVTIALLISWIVAVIFTPYIGYKILPNFQAHPDAHEDAVYQKKFYLIFRRMVTWCVRFRKTVLLATALLFAVALAGFALVEQQFFPSSNRPELLIDLQLPEGSSIRATQAEVLKMEKVLANDADIEQQSVYVGGGAPRFYLPLDIQLPNTSFAQFVVMTKSNDARERVFQRVKDALEKDFPMVRGRVNRLENGPPVGYPIQFRVSGADPETVKALATEAAALVRGNQHVFNVHLDWNERAKVIKLNVDQDKARALNINSTQLSGVLNSILTGYSVTFFREGDKLIEVLARAEAAERMNIGAIGDYNIPLTGGRTVPLSQLVTISYELEDGVVWRRNRLPTVTVRADIQGKIQAPVVTAQIEPLLNPLRAKLPPGYYIEIGGAVEESAKGQDSVAAVMPLMIFVTITLLMIQLQSISRTFLVLITAPLGLIGATFFLLLFHIPFGFVAMLGVIALSGMIMRNSVILVDQIEQDIAAGKPPWEAIIGSTVRRFRPIMLTAAAAILAMIPLTRSDFWGPMAVAIMGGLLVATVLTLLFLPALYAAWFRVKET